MKIAWGKPHHILHSPLGNSGRLAYPVCFHTAANSPTGVYVTLLAPMAPGDIDPQVIYEAVGIGSPTQLLPVTPLFDDDPHWLDTTVRLGKAIMEQAEVGVVYLKDGKSRRSKVLRPLRFEEHPDQRREYEQGKASVAAQRQGGQGPRRYVLDRFIEIY